MATDGCVVAEHFVFDDGFTGADGVVEVGLVIDGVVVSRRRRVGLFLVVDF